MISNYIKSAWRNLVRNRTFSLINMLGLALGLACSLLIILWVQYERSVDDFHHNGNRLFQVYSQQHFDGKVEANYYTQGLLAGELKKSIPEIEYASGLEQNQPATFSINDKIGKMSGTFAGEDFFHMFSYPLLQGYTESALNNPDGVAISNKMAEYFYGSAEKAMGSSIELDNRTSLMVTAVFADLPSNSSMQFDFVRTWKAYVSENNWVHNWNNTSPATFVQLKPNADPQKAMASIQHFIQRYVPKTNGNFTELALQPYTERYLHSNFRNGEISGGRIEYVRLFTIVALFVLLIACINFMNLATARSTKRAKEVGVRKVAGAMRSSLVTQFISEALLLTFFSIVVAVILTSLLLPGFNLLTGKQLSLPLGEPGFWMSLVGLFLFTGLVAGSYPALVLSSMKPISVLKGSFRFGNGSKYLRKGLVIFQFSLSIILIIGMIVIYRQIEYTQQKNLGYDRENLLYVPLEGETIKNYALFKEKAQSLPGIVSITRMKEPPTVISHHIGDVSWSGKDPNLSLPFADAVVGYDFVKTLKLQLTAGRDFSREYGADSVSYIVNETAVKRTGYSDPVGKTMVWGNKPGPIVGVLKDFHFNSMHQAIEPLIIRLDEKFRYGTALIRTKAGNPKQAIAGLEKLWKELNPDFVFTYQFSDLQYAKLYKSEQVVSSLANYFALLAIFISCLGLFGLASFTAEQRTKEIGVRKVLGASVTGIVRLLSANFLQPVAWAMLISFPIAWYVMNRWLDNYAYKVNISWWIFAAAGVVTILIALLTVGFQSIKAAIANPVKSLRAE